MRGGTAGAHAAAIFICTVLGVASGRLPDWYHCRCAERANTTGGQHRGDCVCPSLASPGGLPRTETPQFILFTHDDAIVEETDAFMRAVCDGRFNPNGCPARATMFTMASGTDCDLAHGLWKDGYEMADHTVTHPAMPDGYSKSQTEYQILGARKILSEKCGIPEHEIQGFRNPYLVTNPTVRQVLYANNFLYDSTLEEGRSESISRSMAERVWPYTLGDGIPQNCHWYEPDQKCNQMERYPGLWEVPLWDLTALGTYTMDYASDNRAPLYDVLMANFRQVYGGNRAPLPLYIHTPWTSPERRRDLQRFADYTLALGDVYWVTMTQLIQWMRDPVPASQMTGAMCGMAPPPPPPLPMPHQGINLTMTFRALTSKEFGKKQPELLATVANLLGTDPGTTYVAEITVVNGTSTTPGGGATSAAGGASSAAGGAALAAGGVTSPIPASTAGGVGSNSSAGSGEWPQAPPAEPVGIAAAAPAQAADDHGQHRRKARLLLGKGGEGGRQGQGQADDHLQFEAPTYPLGAWAAGPGFGEVSMASTQLDDIRVTVVAAGPQPLDLYVKATSLISTGTLAAELAPLDLTLADQPAVVPFRDGVAVPLPSPPPPPAPSPPPPLVEAAAGDSVTATAPQPGTATDAQHTGGSSTAGAGAGESSALSPGAIAGIAAGAAAAVALLSAVVVLLARSRRSGGMAASHGVDRSGPSAASAGSCDIPDTPKMDGRVSISIDAMAAQ